MKDKMKGFTLVELLAVIIILAIVALVTTPAILNVINNSRLEGAKDKTWGTIDAVKLAYTQSQTIDNKDIVDNPVVTFSSGSDNSLEKLGRAVTISGEKPTGGTVTKNGKYSCTTNTAGTEVNCCKNATTCAAPEK